MNKISSLLCEIDSVLLSKIDSELPGLFYGLGGCSMYLSNRYSQSNNIEFHNSSIDILERIVASNNQNIFQGASILNHPSFASCCLIDQFTKRGLLDENEKISSHLIIEFIDGILGKELLNNYHDLF